MKKKLFAAALCAFAACALAGGRSGRGHVPGTMDWSHLGPCPAELDCLRDSEKLTLKFGAGGRVTAAGSFRQTSGGKTTTFSKSFSTTLVPVSSGEDGAFRGDAFVFFPSDSKVKFSGFARRIALEWDNFFFRLR